MEAKEIKILFISITCTVHRTVISIEHLTLVSAVFSFCRLVLPFRKGNNFISRPNLKMNTQLTSINTKNYILFKISAPSLFLEIKKKIFSQISASIDILMKYILIEKKECIDENEIDFVHLQKRPEHDFLSIGWMYRCNS